ncbi:hypothetical protein S83_012724, partial [Arachis hypogaea]
AQSCGGPPDLVHPYTLSSSVSCNSSIPSVHSFNKIDCFVCSFCFRFIGSIELQIGRRLYLQGLRDSDSHGCDVGSSSSLLKNFHEMDSSSEDEDQGTHQCGSGSSKDKISLPEGVVESLMNGQLNFPFSKEFSLPSAVRCLGGCGEAYYCRKQTQPTVKQMQQRENNVQSFEKFRQVRRNLEQAKSLVQAMIKREEKKREVMDNEVMLQRIQMKYKREIEFSEDSLALSRLAPYSSKFVSSEEEFFESDMMTSHPHSRPSVVQIHPSYDANPAMLPAAFSKQEFRRQHVPQGC